MPRSPSLTRRDRERSRSPPRHQKRVKELSFYKKSSSSSYTSRDRQYDGGGEEETARDRAERRERGEVPSRFGGTREQGVRNTMGNVGAQSGGVGSFKRSTDPLDRMGVRGENGGKDRDRDERSYRDRDDRRDRDRDDRRDRERHSHRDRDRDRDRDERRDRDPRNIERPSAPTPNAASSLTNGPPERKPAAPASAPPPAYGRMIEVTANDRMGRKVRVKCMPTDTVGDLKKLIAAQTGTVASKIQLKKWYTNFKDHVSLQDYEINDGMSLEMY